ncbi:MAG: hypothetical protein ACRDOM_10120 [Nocardioides sp.]
MSRRSGLLLGAALAMAMATGCGGQEAAPASDTEPRLPQTSDPVELDPDDFTADIDNEYWPMEPGTRWTYREIDEEGKVIEVVVTVSSETKEIANGVTARVVRDTVTEDGDIIEDTLDWYAQDPDGTIWYLGENTAEFENGKVATRGGSFEAGVDGAMAGVIMPGDPEVGMAYRQEYYQGEAEDNGEILSLEEMAEVPAGKYDDVLLTKDTITIEPDVLEYKLYAKGVGPVLVFGVSGGAGREDLVSMTTVAPSTAEAAGTTPLGKPTAEPMRSPSQAVRRRR